MTAPFDAVTLEVIPLLTTTVVSTSSARGTRSWSERPAALVRRDRRMGDVGRRAMPGARRA